MTNYIYMQHISLVNSTVNLNIEGSKYTVSLTFHKGIDFSCNNKVRHHSEFRLHCVID